MHDPIAIIGLACRYPGADDPDQLWDAVLSQRRMFRRIPDERLRLADYYAADPAVPDAVYSTHAALLEDYEFDRVGYRVAGPTYRSTDLTHWLALDVAGKAIEDAALDHLRPLSRDRIGVLVGNTLTGEFSRSGVMRLRWPYVRRTVSQTLARAGMSDADRRELLAQLEADYKAPFPPMGEESLAGGLSNTIAGRICGTFDLHGGGYTVDGACASSLLAVASAADALRAGQLDAVLAGGVDLSIDPFELVGFAKTGALATDQMRVYDQRSRGFWPGEGCGFAVLARESDAVAWGARIYALLRGWGRSSDGRGGITRPEETGQRLALLRAYEQAGYGPHEVEMFEGHGTGTAVGDATELRALAGVSRESGQRGRPAALGTVKANIGHTKAAAGAAGLLKAVLSLDRGVLPPTTGCERPHAELTAPGTPLRVLREPEPWPDDAPRRASVSAMGFGGINAHLTLSAVRDRSRARLTSRERLLGRTPQDTELILLGAADRAGLVARARQLADHAPDLSFGGLRDLAIDTARDLPADPAVRAAVPAATPAEFGERAAALAEALADERPGPDRRPLDPAAGFLFGEPGSAPRIGFLFPGQAAPAYPDGGALARRFPTTSQLFATVAEALRDLPDLPDTSGPGAPVDTAAAQPAVAACSAAAVHVLHELGVTARVAVGHSLGELTALHWAGTLGARDLVELARARGRAMSRCPGRPGAMAAVMAPLAETTALIDGLDLAVAGYNGPEHVVVSGPADAIERALDRGRRGGVRTVRLPVSHAFHSPLMADAAPALRAALDRFGPLHCGPRVVSTVTGRPHDPARDLRPLLVGQLWSPVRFDEAITAASADLDLLIEVGPGRILAGLATGEGRPPAVATDAGAESLSGVLAALGTAYVLGAPLRADRLAEGRYRAAGGDPLRRPAFLANPCESAPTEDTGDAAPATPVRAPSAADHDGAPPRSAPAADPRTSDGDPLQVVRRLIAQRSELPVEAVGPQDGMLTDLNLNSITVGQLAADAAAELGVRPPVAATEFATATVAELAAVLAEAEPDDGTGAEGPPPGVAGWLRPFEIVWVDRPRAGAATPHRWELVTVGGPDASGRTEVGAAFGGGTGDAALAVHVAADRDPQCAKELLEALRRALDPAVARLAVLHRGGAAGITRTLALERPDLPIRVIDLSTGAAAWTADELRREAETGDGFEEVRRADDGTRQVPRLRFDARPPDTRDAPVRFGANDVLLATGGGKGIGAESVLGLVQRTGARVAVVGRARPADDTELAGNLRRMRDAGITVHYVRADITDPAAVNTAVEEAEEALGPVTAILHSAGANRPRLLADLGPDELAATLGPKTTGLSHLLDAVDTARLRAVVAFGSVIARTGMRGEADYALANEWLRLDVEDAARRLPGCRCLTVEWSVWSGAGMGERLDIVGALARMGVAPIAPDDGVALLRRHLDEGRGGTSVVASGRLGDPPTLPVDRPDLPVLRFVERTPVHYPGIELVAEADLSGPTDGYLAEHALDGLPLLPAVVGLEAMAQAAAALVGRTPDGFTDIDLARPVTVPDDGRRRIRIAALVRGADRVEVVVRSDETGFDADHFRAVARFDLPDPQRVAADAGLAAAPGRAEAPTGATEAPAELYDRLLFHGPSFRRVASYRTLHARTCTAAVATRPAHRWFGDYLPQRLLLGDFGARDAFIHAAQACVPHRRVLPEAVARIRSGPPPDGGVEILAVERASDAERLTYDLVVRDADGTVCEVWEGLVLRVLAPLPEPPDWGGDLFVPYLERRVGELLDREVVAGLADGGGERDARSRTALRRALGREVRVEHRPDGRPFLAGAGDADRHVSFAHGERHTLAVLGHSGVACDLEEVGERAADQWRGMLGGAGFGLAQLLGAELGEDLDRAATRVWSALECVRKAGRPSGEPLVLDRSGSEGWAVLRSGGMGIVSGVMRLGGSPAPLAVAVLAASAEGRAR
ncbi:type I polyketide synthase [Nocardiopsis rhodophaea]|uniref:Type I polyketide synthase n=2 Tax=Nocardiopsis rhodophaea TaxID=280238 RepID=A0ABP5DU43_9ACTN